MTIENGQWEVRLAVRKTNPKIYDEVMGFLQDKPDRDSTKLLELGKRYSPKAIRLLVATTLGTVSSDSRESYRVPNQYQFSNNLLFYAFIMGFISKFERTMLNEGIPLFSNFSKDENDAYIGTHPNSDVKIAGSVASLAAKVTIERQVNPKSKFVLFHGKWNVPHLGYFAFIHDSLMEISQRYDIPSENLKPLIIGERNEYIKSTGKRVFMNRDRRMSLMSYMPGLFTIAPGGNITAETARDYWSLQYNNIRPDFLPIEINDELSVEKMKNAKSVGMETVLIPSSLQVHGKRSFSSSALVNGQLDDETFETVCRKFETMFKDRWRRKW